MTIDRHECSMDKARLQVEGRGDIGSRLVFGNNIGCLVLVPIFGATGVSRSFVSKSYLRIGSRGPNDWYYDS